MVDDWYEYQIAAFKRMAIPSKGRHHVNALTGGQEFPITILSSKPNRPKGGFVFPGLTRRGIYDSIILPSTGKKG